MHCNICNKSLYSVDFLKSDGLPKYFVDSKFYPIVDQTVFCSPECSNKWYVKNYYNKEENAINN